MISSATLKGVFCFALIGGALIGGCNLSAAATITVSFAAIPAVPTLQQCHDLFMDDLAVMKAAYDAAEQNRLATYREGSIAGSRIQNQNISEDLRLGHISSLRHAECLRLADSARQANLTSLAGNLGSKAPQAWMSGLSAIDAAAWSGLPPSARFAGFTAIASQSFLRSGKIEKAAMTVNFAGDIGRIFSNGSSRGDLISDFIFKSGNYAQSFLGRDLPPWSKMFVSFSISSIEAIARDASTQLSSEMMRFDAGAEMQVLARDISGLERQYRAVSQLSALGSDDVQAHALQALDAAAIQVAALAKAVDIARADQRLVESRRIAAARAQEAAAQSRLAAQARNSAARDAASQRNERTGYDNDSFDWQAAAANRMRLLEAERARFQQQREDAEASRNNDARDALGLLGGVLGALGRGGGSSSSGGGRNGSTGYVCHGTRDCAGVQ